MSFLIDHNIEKHGKILSDMLVQQGWFSLIPVGVVTFAEIDLTIDSGDRQVWRTAQKHHLILITANRRMIGEDSLEQVLREENTLHSLPVLTMADSNRFLNDSVYRDRCVIRIMDIVFNIENLMGSKRLFIP